MRKSGRNYLSDVRQPMTLLIYPGIASWPEVSASAILRQIASQKLTAPSGGIISPSTVAIRPLTVFESINPASRARWVLLFVDRVVVGQVPRETVAIEDGEPEVYRKDNVRFFRKKGIVVDDLVLHCGEDRLTIAGPTMGTILRILRSLAQGAWPRRGRARSRRCGLSSGPGSPTRPDGCVQQLANAAMMAPALSASGVVRYDGVTRPSLVRVNSCRSSSTSRSTILSSAIDVVPL